MHTPRLLAVAAAGFLAMASGAQAAIIAALTESGDDVVFEFSGSFDTTGYSQLTEFTLNNVAVQADNYIGNRNGTYGFYNMTASGPTAIGGGDFASVSSDVTGDTFFLNFKYDNVGLSKTYVSGSDISGSGVFENATLASLGVEAGVYTWNFVHGETVTLTVGGSPATVPLPAAGGMLLAAVGLLGLRRRKG